MRILPSILLLLSLSACSYLPHWLGNAEDETDPETKAKRVSALKEESLLVADPRLKTTSVSLPKPYRNPGWAQANDQQIEAYQHLDLPPTLEQKVKIHIGKGVQSGLHLTASPVVAEGVLYAVDSKGYISAYDTSNLEKRLWRSKTLFRAEKKKGFVGGGLAYANHLLFSTNGFNEVVALDAKNGNIIWRKTLDSVTRAAPIIANGKVLVLSVDNKTYALNTSDGKLAWTHSGVTDTLGTLGAPPAAYTKGIILVPYASGELYALRENNGIESWYDNIAGNVGEGRFSPPDIDASPVIAYGKVFAASSGGFLIANTIATGNRVWEQDLSLSKTPWVAGNMLFAVTPNAELVAVSVSNGGIKWVVQLPRAGTGDAGRITWSGPVLAGGLIRVVGSQGEMLSVSPNDGNIVSRNTIPKDVYAQPVVADGALYLLNDEADITQLR